MSAAISLDKDPIKPLFFKYYIPTLTGLLSVTIHQVIDGIILGQYVGKEGVAAVGLFGPVLTIFIAVALAFVIGGGILIAQSIGAEKYDRTIEVFQFTTSLIVIFGCIVVASTIVLVEPITSFLVGGEDPKLFKSTYNYMFWGFLWAPFFFLRMLWGSCVTNDGAPKVHRNASMIAVCLNIALDVLLIIVFPLGTAGASIATGISVFISAAYLFFFIRKGSGHLNFDNFKVTLRLKEWKELINYGIPTFASEISFSIGLLLINMSLVLYGSLAVSAFGLVNHISFIFLRLFTAAMISALPIISFNIGAGLSSRVMQTLKFSILFTFVLGLIVSVIGFVGADFLVGIFSGKESVEFEDMAVQAIGLYFILFIAAGPNYILSAYFQSIGKSFMSIVTTLLKNLVLVGLLLLVLPNYLGIGLNGVWLSRSFAEIGGLMIIVFFTLYKRKGYFSHDIIIRKTKE